MKNTRLLCAMFLLWMLAVHNADKLPQFAALLPLIDLMAVAVALPILLICRVRRMPTPVLLILPAAALLLLKTWAGYPIAGAGLLTGSGLPLSVMECGILAVTAILARRLGNALEEVRTSLAKILLERLQQHSLPFHSGQSEMYREIRRARRHQRPLALMVVSPSKRTLDASLERFAGQIAEQLAGEYSTVQIAQFLSDEMKDCDIITQQGGRFVILLPETDHSKATETVQRLQAVARSKLDLELKFGVSVFPDEEITFVGLLERAETAAHNDVGDARTRLSNTLDAASRAPWRRSTFRPELSTVRAMHQPGSQNSNGVVGGQHSAAGDVDQDTSSDKA